VDISVTYLFSKNIYTYLFTKKKYSTVQLASTAQKQQLRWNKSAFDCVQVCLILILECSE